MAQELHEKRNVDLNTLGELANVRVTVEDWPHQPK